MFKNLNCQQCDKELSKNQIRYKNKFCCNECSSEAQRKIKRQLNCTTCNKPLTTQIKFCNKSCAARTNNVGKRRRGKSLEDKQHKCEYCAKLTINKKFCSMDCRNESKRKNISKDVKDARNRDYQSKYRSKRFRKIDETADKNKIAEIYKNCPYGYEVDHIIPLSKGGKHHEDNLQYLTKDENRRKGSRIL